ncbi:CTP synthetase [Spiroplasma sp. TIUS-1]|uniref:CTP synthase n=1 Tax=Spiroplasma sp. TIUS-1 TaxID=216963 RepID=UPI001398BBD8|nr:CTP synthase [Spiroplasma sp. TIUS-1]QHX35700.1 CTP synthetase [Spiroplasma sp. TIUS-1]
MGKQTKYIFITGGVVSGLGKGIAGSSIGAILKSSGKSVFMQKLDPYLNMDPGTMNPVEHGEVYVTADGGETDLDLGHYERFIDTNLSKTSSYSAGKIYWEVLNNERKGVYKGQTVQTIPHITEKIIEKIYDCSSNNEVDFVIVEIGGTIGDIESQPFIEAIRQIQNRLPEKDTLFVHVALLTYVNVTGEFKTKPIQHSVKEMLSHGIQPDILIARSDVNEVVPPNVIKKISNLCNLKPNQVIIGDNQSSIYDVPLALYKQNIHDVIADKLDVKLKPNLKAWIEASEKKHNATNEVKISIVGKYIALQDAYLSVSESLKIAGIWNNTKVKINWVNSRTLTETNIEKELKDSDGILVPGGFGINGVEGKILAAKYARINKIPYLGICLGMQVATIEFARNVLGYLDANSSEFNPESENQVIHLIEGNNKDQLGGTLRLGEYETTIIKGTLAEKIYGSKAVERHRHRYEFNNKYRDEFEKAGMKISGIYKKGDLVELIEITDHPFFLASQYHPEFTSRLSKPNPMFNGFIKAVISKK